VLDKREIYAQQKLDKINEIKKMLDVPNISPSQRYEVQYKLYEEYSVFFSDSSISYLRKNLELGLKENNPYHISQSKIKLTQLYTVAGMFLDARNTIGEVDKRSLPPELLINYYDANKLLYGFYSKINTTYTCDYYAKSCLYRDSLLLVLPLDSRHYNIVYTEKLYDDGNIVESKKILTQMLSEIEGDTHEKAILYYALANVYKKENDKDMQYACYMISAICDIKNAIKENISMRELALLMYEKGDIYNAFKCIGLSMEDAMFSNSQQRTLEVSQIFPIIDAAYREKIESKNKELVTFIILISILSVFLIILVIYVYKQMKRISGIRKELYQTNLKLNDLNKDLQDNNVRLKQINNELYETNQLKEVYIGQFLDLCSEYINKLEKYKNTLNKKALERKFDELIKILKSNEIIDNELKALYENFDHIFLHLYPNFVDDFNSLLVDEARFELSNPNELNTELRIYALIRLGITDSSKIANFLHYSANTIYNYRTRLRNKSAVPREDFEYRVRKIGFLSK